jgi:hypothetical protein
MQVYEYAMPQSRFDGKMLGTKTLFTTSKIKGDQHVRYFSGIDAEIYFDEMYIDEIVQFQYQIQQNTMPLFGYNSYVFDQVAVGSRMVQGTFAVNFTQANYLFNVLSTLKGLPTNSINTITATDEGTIEQYNSIYNQEGLKSLSGDPILQYQRNPLWNKSFNIVVSYGDALSGSAAPGATVVILTGVQITGCSQQFGIGGEPILESYSFIARDIETKDFNIATQPNILDMQVKKENPVIVTPQDAVFFNSIVYDEKIANKTAKGSIQLDYATPVEISEFIFLVPDMKLENQRSKNGSMSFIPKGGLTTFDVPASFRYDIKDYFNKTKRNYLNMDIMIKYKNDGKDYSVTVKKKMNINNILD